MAALAQQDRLKKWSEPLVKQPNAKLSKTSPPKKISVDLFSIQRFKDSKIEGFNQMRIYHEDFEGFWTKIIGGSYCYTPVN